MKELYSIEELKTNHEADIKMQRYLHKYNNDKKNFKKLKPHEKHYVFSWMPNIRDDNNVPIEDIYNLEIAEEYLFNKLILQYSDCLDFKSPIMGPYGYLTEDQIQKDKTKFEELYNKWIAVLSNPKGAYLPLIIYEINKKGKSIIGEIQRKRLNLKYFFIYYKAKYFLDSKKDKCCMTEINGHKLVANAYSYIHILSRHYVPDLDDVSSMGTLNADIKCIDIERLPPSILELIKKYHNHKEITTCDEYRNCR